MAVFFCASVKHGPIVDEAMENGRGLYTGLNQAELTKRYGSPVLLLEVADAIARTEEGLKTQPVEVTEERFWDLLEVLPPCKWRHVAGGEGFHMSERINFSIVTWCIRLGKQYFTFDDTDQLTTEAAIQKVRMHLETSAQPA